jgi:hypothetical protein
MRAVQRSAAQQAHREFGRKKMAVRGPEGTASPNSLKWAGGGEMAVRLAAARAAALRHPQTPLLLPLITHTQLLYALQFSLRGG